LKTKLLFVLLVFGWMLLCWCFCFVLFFLLVRAALSSPQNPYGYLTLDKIFGGCGKGTPREKKKKEGNKSRYLFILFSKHTIYYTPNTHRATPFATSPS